MKDFKNYANLIDHHFHSINTFWYDFIAIYLGVHELHKKFRYRRLNIEIAVFF